MKAICRQAADEDDTISNSLREAENASRQVTADALSQLGDSTSQRVHDYDETATVQEGLSPKVEVDEYLVDMPTLEADAA
eukprot:2394517-Amphidinium_carterae.2